MFIVEVCDVVMSKSCPICEQHERHKRRIASTLLQELLFQGHLLGLGLALAEDIGVAHGRPAKQSNILQQQSSTFGLAQQHCHITLHTEQQHA
jgi:hypothetical protein